MIDKQIIIDGVDVSGCEWFGQIDLDINVICTSNSPKKCNTYCKDISNCYYKQLVRKEQECEKYKQALAKVKEICSEINCESLMQNSWCGNTDFKMGCCEKYLRNKYYN